MATKICLDKLCNVSVTAENGVERYFEGVDKITFGDLPQDGRTRYILKKAYIETQNDEKFDSKRLEQLFFDDYPAQDSAEVVAVFDTLKEAKKEFEQFDISAKDMGRYTLRAVKFIESIEDEEDSDDFWDIEVARTPAEELVETNESDDGYDDIHEIEFCR